MSRFRIEIAERGDDAELRRVLASTPMPGAVSIAFRREPSFFDAAVVDGGFHQTVIARDCETGSVAGFGTRSVRQRYVNGKPAAVGYLSGLRLLPPYRGSGLLARGFRFFKELHQDGRTQLYLTTIAADNAPALAVLEAARAGLPRYHLAGTYHTLMIPLARGGRCAKGTAKSVHIRPAMESDLPAVIDFLRSAGPARQFLPCYEAADFFSAGGTFRDLKPQDLLLAMDGGAVIGTLGCWDQSAFRQTVVASYDGATGWARPLDEGSAALRRQPELPRPGERFRHVTAALILVQDDDPQVFAELLDEAVRISAKRHRYFLIGLHESDPLLPAAAARQAASYCANLYSVCWRDGEELRAQLDGRPPYLELGCL
jgi:hypothetical protein